MRTKYILLTIVLALVLSNTLPVYAATTSKSVSEREITIIEKRVCFNVTIGSSIDNETVTKKICVIVKFHVINARPSDATMNITFPVYINIGNRTVENTVVVPLKIKGEVSKIEVYPVGKESTTSEPENVIIVVPEEKTQTTTTTAPKPAATTSSKPKTITSPKTTPPKQTTKKPEEVVTMPMPPPRTTREPDVLTVALILSILVVTGVGLYYIVMKRRKVEKKEISREEEKSGEDIETYREALKMMKQQLEEKEKELQELKSSFTYRIYCPKCKEPVTPIKTHDNRLICPKCNTVLGKIRSDGTLDIFPPKNREKNERGSKKEGGEVQRRDNKETARTDEEG